MPDQSSLDERYFVDDHVYNCPFCNRRNVSYSVVASISFDWTQEKTCYAYFVRCQSCRKKSMHFSYTDLEAAIESMYQRGSFSMPGLEDGIDHLLFFSVPTSFFVMDSRVPRVLRELLTEAEGSLKSNFLTGASACARKIVYELSVDQGSNTGNYEDRIKSLKEEHPEVDGTYFDTLLTIQQVTSSKVHESAYDGWEGKHVRLILATLREVLHQLYVVPALREDSRQSILALKSELLGEKRDSSKEEGTGFSMDE